MGIGNTLLLSQCTAYLLALVLSFFMAVPMGQNQRNFDGKCLLYARGTWSVNASSEVGWKMDITYWGSQSVCNYSIYMGIVTMIVAFVQVVRTSYFLYKGLDSSFLDAFVSFVVNFILTTMLFTSALILTMGLSAWCREVTQHIYMCEEAQYSSWLNWKGIDTSFFYIQLGMAQFGSWCGWVCWLIATMLTGLRVYNYHQREDILRSLRREKDRLVGSNTEQRPLLI
ncbi:transmembrane protein 179-like [Branchiostoma floridae]|uniref:Transmembrane protein 179-like n=1 Tax=Branchiostoma floridae TaxID=7739 RepID=A0A9J7KT52_BRAFL|nr:transmembrane protein 179-like [Branchiostoma floridae]